MKSVRASNLIVFALLCLIIGQAVFLDIAWSDEESPDRVIEDHEGEPVAKPEESYDRILEGFEDQPEENSLRAFDAENSATQKTNRNETVTVSVNGSASIRSTYNYAAKEPEADETDWRGLSSLRSEMTLKLDTKLGKKWSSRISGRAAYDAAYDINGRNTYSDDVQDSYISELELLETYVQGSLLRCLDIKAGRQVVVWGKLDNIRVTDILNPLNLREFGATDMEDLRLPVNMLKIDGYVYNWTLTGAAIPEIRFNKNPEYGSDFYPAALPPIHEEIPENGFEHMEYALSASAVFKGWDIAFYWADVYNDASHIKRLPGLFQMAFVHARLTLYGAAFNIAYGNWLLKAEAAHISGLQYFNTADETYSRTDLGTGIEFSGFKETTLGVEVVQRYIHAYGDVLKNDPDNLEEISTQSAVRLTKDWRNETFSLTVLASAFGTDLKKGSFQRYELDYDLSDNLLVKGGLIAYQSGMTTGFGDVEDNDRLFLELKYSF